jgi:hypothetical protein
VKSALKLLVNRLTLDQDIESLGFSLAELSEKTCNGLTIAHEFAAAGAIFSNPAVIELSGDLGWSVAHEMAKTSKWCSSDLSTLRLTTKTGITAAHTMARKGHTFSNFGVLAMRDHKGWTVAHEMAKNGRDSFDPEALKLVDDNGWTVAHEMAANGYRFDDLKTLQLSSKLGETVAHVSASMGQYFNTPNIQAMQTKDGVTVRQYFEKAAK